MDIARDSARGRHPGLPRRLPRLRLPVDAAGADARTARRRLDLGISLFAGEAEGRFDEVLRDAWHGTLKPLYNYMDDLPSLAGATMPILPASRIKRTGGSMTSFDAGRGCPFLCSFCTIINVQGRKSRRRSADDVEQIIRRNLAQGINRFFITDDNFARNTDWESIFDRLIQMREQEKLNIKFIIQVDTMCHRLPHFIEKAGRAGVARVFIGLESINPDSLLGARKKQNKITEYRKMLLAWKHAGATIFAGYILGFPERHAGIDHPRHQDHPARAAHRPAGVPLPDAAARLRGPPEALQGRRLPRSRSEQVRPGARDRGARHHVARAVGAGLSRMPGRRSTRPST